MKPCRSADELGPAMEGQRRRWKPSGREAGSVCLYFADRRPGRSLVLMHDLRATSTAYEVRPLFESFRWRRPTFAVDLPGFGLSSGFPTPCAPAQSAGLLGELLHRLRRAELPIDLVTLGRSSQLAARVARDEPGLVRSIVMLEPSCLLAERGVMLESIGARVEDWLGERAGRAFFTLSTTRSLVRRSLGARFRGAPDQGLVEYTHASARAPGADRARLAAMAHRACAGEMACLYRALTVPVLVVHGCRGARSAGLEAFLRSRHNRFALRVSQTRGMPQFERPRETTAALERFWQSLPHAAFECAMR